MTARDQSLRTALRKRYPKLRSASQSRSGAGNVSSAASAGRSAADQVNLSRPVGRNRGLALPFRR